MKLHLSDFGTQAGGVNVVLAAHRKHLQEKGVQFVDEFKADLVIAHAVDHPSRRIDVFHSHGFYPTAHPGWTGVHNRSNELMFHNMMTARKVVSVSQLAAEIMRRDFHIDPQIIRNGIDLDLLQPGGRKDGYILWPKMAVNPTCDPTCLQDLANKHPGLPYASLVKLPGILSFGVLSQKKFWDLLSQCSIYLATTRENCSMGMMEAMAIGIPVVGYRWGFTQELESGCELADPGDDLYPAIQKVLSNWKQYSEEARQYAHQHFSWKEPIEELYSLYQSLLEPRQPDTLSVVIPLHNYARWVGEAIQSVKESTKQPDEIIVVDDASTDDPQIPKGVRLIRLEKNRGVAFARNFGISEAKGNLILCLDADDLLHKTFIQNALIHFKDPRVGIVYGAAHLIAENGNSLQKRWFTAPFSYLDQCAGRNTVPTCNIFRKEAWERAGGYRSYEQPCEDAGLWLRIASQGWRIQHMDVLGFHYRTHKGSLTQNLPKPDWWRDNRAWKIRNAGVYGTSRPVQIYDCPQVCFEVIGTQEQVIRTLDSIEGLKATSWEVKALELKGYPFVHQNKRHAKIMYYPSPGEVITDQTWENIVGEASSPWGV